MRFFVRTYGCQMNERDSDSVAALLVKCGHEPADDEGSADLVLVNTCSVRGKAEEKAIGKLGLLTATKRARPGRVVGAFGCMVQRMGEDLLRKVRGLDLAVGPGNLDSLPRALDSVRAGKGPVLLTGRARSAIADHLRTKPCAFVNILLGCDRRCAYCIVPAVRGPEWSRPASEILAETRSLAGRGVREITLLGQSVMSYGRKNAVWSANHTSPLGFEEPLPRLLETVAAVPGIMRVRFTSGHPSGCTAELARAMAAIPQVCEHLHLPVQSGSDRILRRMGRGYSADGYRRAVERLRRRVPDISLTTDVIVGFPSETETDFELTRALLEDIGFDNAFVFKYSPRPGTPAMRWEDDVPADEKMRRNKALLEDQEARGLRLNRPLVGRSIEVLVEGPSRTNRRRMAGRTRTNKIVIFDPFPGIKAGDMMTVKIERALSQTLYGTGAVVLDAGRQRS